MSSNVLAARDVNASLPAQNQAGAQTDGPVKPDVMSMEYHRQVFQSKIEQGEYVTINFLAHSKENMRSKNQRKSRTETHTNCCTFFSPGTKHTSPHRTTS
jgi:hypothetical protein